MEAKNLKEFKALVERYETITIEEIKLNWIPTERPGYDTAGQLTGFGRPSSCSLCKSANHNCTKCVYGKRNGCFEYINSDSYDAIEETETPEELLTAFRNRASHLRKTYLK